MTKNKVILCIGDLHFPYHHIDTLDFLKAIKLKYKPDRVIQGGDELDYHAISFHDSDPGLPNSEKEFDIARGFLKQLEKIFPSMDILDSNHGSLVERKQKHHGLPRQVFKPMNERYGVSKNWKWHKSLTIKMSNGSYCYFHHGKNADVMKTSMSMGMSVVQFHYHEKMCVQYWANPLGLYFAAQAGCSVDDHSMAMAYNDNNLKRPLLGHLIIIDGMAKNLPMVLNKKGRWIGLVP